MDGNAKLAGFTLIELVLVIMVVSILATMVYLNWPGKTLNLDAQAQQLANDIRYTQALATNKGDRFYLIRVSTTTYEIRNLAGTPIATSTGATTITLNSGITFGTFTNLPNNLIAFDSEGTPYVNTLVPGTALAATATMVLTTGSESRTISITQQTGRVAIT